MKLDINTINDTEKIMALLPPQIQEFVLVIGLSATLTLVNRFGGLSFEVPHGIDGKNGQWLVRELGFDVACAFVKQYQGSRVYINNCDALRGYLRNVALVDVILAKMETGIAQHRAIQETAPEFGISERRAYEILRQMTDSKQPDLFNHGEA